MVENVKFNIEDQGVGVVEVVELQTQHNKFKSFRLCIRKKDLQIMQSENFEMPEGTVHYGLKCALGGSLGIAITSSPSNFPL